ncbi:META domain-containing protein [Thiorhodococcus fuscus]|uniref:META domain-containing protein n=1 Tax=Thiorhodococcus fuscus TaxID=527200 RepID=A0ABW4Y9J7_9GAMM
MLSPIARTLTSATLGLFVQAVLAAEPDTATPPALPNPGIENIAWQLVGYGTDDGFAKISTDAKPAYLRFQSGQMSGSTGCNQISGAYRNDSANLAFDMGMATTRKACSKPLMLQERHVLAALSLVAAYRIEGDRLLMLDTEGNQVLELRAASHSPLVGHVWQLEGYDDGSGTLIAPLRGAGIDLTFLGTGVLGGSNGCNRYMSGYLSDETHLQIGPIATTRVACPTTDGRAEQASAYATALGKVAGFDIDGRRLTLLSTAGAPLARYRALEANPSATKSSP